MNDQQHIPLDINSFLRIDEQNDAIEQKLNELELLLSSANINSEQVKYYKKRIDESFDKSQLNKNISAYQKLDEQELSTNDRLDQLMNLLAENPVDSTVVKHNNNVFWLKKIIVIIIAILMIAIGFIMIVLPAPPEFEMFTIYYFSRNDGVTLMDLISLLIIFGGVFLLVTNMRRKVNVE